MNGRNCPSAKRRHAKTKKHESKGVHQLRQPSANGGRRWRSRRFGTSRSRFRPPCHVITWKIRGHRRHGSPRHMRRGGILLLTTFVRGLRNVDTGDANSRNSTRHRHRRMRWQRYRQGSTITWSTAGRISGTTVTKVTHPRAHVNVAKGRHRGATGDGNSPNQNFRRRHDLPRRHRSPHPRRYPGTSKGSIP